MTDYEKYAKIRDSKGLNDTQVSRMSGVSRASFGDWKFGRSKPKFDKIARIAAALGVSPIELTDSSIDTEEIGVSRSAAQDMFDSVMTSIVNKNGQSANGFYVDADILRLSQEAKDSPQRKKLFKLSSKVSPEDLELACAILEKFVNEDLN